MRILLVITKRFLLDLVRQRSNIIWMIVMPLVFTFLFGVLPNLDSSKMSVAVIDNNRSVVSHAFIRTLEHSDGVQVKPIQADEVTQTLRDMQANLVITLPKGLEANVTTGETPAIGWLTAPTASQSSSSDGLIVSDLRSQVNRWFQVGAANVEIARHHGVTSTSSLAAVFDRGMAQGQSTQSLVRMKINTVASGQVHNAALSSTARTLAWFATMFIIFTVFSSTDDVFREKLSGT